MAKEKRKIKKIIKEIVSRLEQSDIKVNRLILYGSYAHNKQKPYSDIDIAIISSSFNGKNILKRQEVLGEILFDLGEPIEALGYTTKEYNHPIPASFLSEIISTGKIVYECQ